MESRGRISELAAIIQSKTNAIEEHLAAEKLSSPTFDPGTSPLPNRLSVHADDIWDATTELQALVDGPVAYLTRITNPATNITISLEALYRYKIPYHLGIDETVSFGEISQRSGLDESDAQRLIRMAISYHIFCEPQKGYIAHTSLSKAFLDYPLLHQWIGTVCREMLPSAIRAVDAIQQWPGSQEPDHTAFSLANREGCSFFETIGQDPKRTQRFSDAMLFLQAGPAFDLEHLFKALDWDAAGCPQTLVDVGGSNGSIALKLLERYPSIQKCIVEDLPFVIESSEKLQHLGDRLEFRAHDFFQEQPVRDADAFFLRSILHDWSDKYAVQILKGLIPAMDPATKIYINEVCLPEAGRAPSYRDAVMRGYDLAMKHTFNSKERDADEWKTLLQTADPRFQLKSIKSAPGSFLSLIEVSWAGTVHPQL